VPLKRVRSAHVNDTRIEFRHHFPETVLALFRDALAFECSARQGKLWQFGDWVARGGVVESAASALLLDERAYAACLRDPETAAKVLDDTAEALRLGFHRAVPSWVVGRRPRRGHQGELTISEAIKREAGAWAVRGGGEQARVP
jgi:2-hydroxychromene-2-carboxylate isomerase